MTVHSRTPDDLTISPRDRDYGQAATPKRWWLRDDPIATAVLNAFSATFPQGERFFIESVVQFKDRTAEPLTGQIKAFVRQEAMHTREHIAFNRQVVGAGYDIAPLEARTAQRLAIVRARQPVAQLALTVAMEHFTAILANALLSEPRHLDGAPAAERQLWRWHSVEEIEHKSVAFDTYLAATAKLSPFKRWSIRVRVMALTTYLFTRTMSQNIADLLRQDGLDPVAERGRALKHLFGKGGLLRGALGHYLDFYRPGFHPWALDDRRLVTEAEASFA